MKTKLIATLMLSLFLASIMAIAVTFTTASPSIVIDGVISLGEWDTYYLGTSVTTWGGGMSVNVYGFADDTYLYVAYVADTSQPGWSVACGLGVNCNFYYRTPQSASWPDQGYTLLATAGYPDEVCQTDGSDWVNKGAFVDNGIDIAYEDIMYGTPPGTNVAELKIPLSLPTYAGTDYIIELGGQYWQYDRATPFYVTFAPPPAYWFKASGGGVSYSDVSGTSGDYCTIGVIGMSLETSEGIGDRVPCKGSGTFVDHDLKIKISFNIEEGAIVRADNLIYFWGTANVFDIYNHEKAYNIPFRLGLVDDEYGGTNRFDVQCYGYYWHGTLLPDSEVTVWVWE
jgi:hypothetical protein